MARITVSVTVIFLLFTLSYAYNPLDLTEHDRVPSITVPESDFETTTILLPSEKPDTEPNTVVEFEPEVTSSEIKPEAMFAEPDLTRPLTIVSIRPINRHFPNIHGGERRLPHRCHHHHQHRREISSGDDFIVPNEDHNDDVMKVDDSQKFHEEFHHHRDHHNQQYGREISYGNDMLIANEDGTVTVVDDSKLFHEEFHHDRDRSYGNDMLVANENRDVTKFDDPAMFHEEFHHHRDHHHHEGSKFPMRHEDDKMKRPFFFHHLMHHDNHHHHHHHHHMDEQVEDMKHKEGFGLMNRVHKFLNHF